MLVKCIQVSNTSIIISCKTINKVTSNCNKITLVKLLTTVAVAVSVVIAVVVVAVSLVIAVAVVVAVSVAPLAQVVKK